MATALLAAIWGGAPERTAAALLIAAYAVTRLAARPLAARYGPLDVTMLTVDLLLLAGLLLLSVRADRSWPIVLTALHSLTVLGYLGGAVNPALRQLGYAIFLTLPAWLGMSPLWIGIVTHQRRLRQHGVDKSWRTRSNGRVSAIPGE